MFTLYKCRDARSFILQLLFEISNLDLVSSQASLYSMRANRVVSQEE